MSDYMSTADALQTAVYGIGALGFMPLALVAIGAIRNARKRARRERMLERHAARIYHY